MKNIGTLIWDALKRNFKVLLTELQRIVGLDEQVTTPETQQVINKVLACAVTATAAILSVWPGAPGTAKTVANALFTAASWLWNGKEPRIVSPT